MDDTDFNASAYALLFLRSSGLPPALVLDGTGLSEQDLQQADYISSHNMSVMLHNINNHNTEPGWAARVGSQLNISAHGPLGFAALSAPTLGTALQVMHDYHAVRITSISSELKRCGDRLQFSMSDHSGDADYGRWLAESTLKVIESLIETIVGHAVGEHVMISFAYPAPAYANSLRDIYGAACEFGCATTAISIPASWSHIRSPLYDESTYRSNIANCREIIGRQSRGLDPAHRVINIFASHFDRVLANETLAGAPPGLPEIARQLHVSPRTLIRHLQRGNTSYKQLLENARQHAAEELLRRVNLSVADVGHKLGYRDPANFGRAFRSWKGVTPAAWRRQQR